MKRVSASILVIGIIAFIAFFIVKDYTLYQVKIGREEISWSIFLKGYKNSKDLVYDEENQRLFIAIDNKIHYVDSNGKSSVIMEEENFNILSLAYKDNNIYYIASSNLYRYNISNKKKEIVLRDIPSFGDYKKNNLMVKDGYLYLSIGAATNSGVVGQDNLWMDKYPFNHDISPRSITLKGKNFDNGTTGAFTTYKTKNISGQIIPGHYPGNASVIRISLSDNTSELFAWGIRNITGMDFNSSKKIYAAVGGMEDRGFRPVKGDFDYIFEIRNNLWYGWPDYSGGDPVDSPRFKGENNLRLSFLLEKHPTTNPPAPYHQHNNLSAITSLSIDKQGILESKDCIYFYDNKDNILYGLNTDNTLNEVAFFEQDTNIEKIIFTKNSLLLLDSNKGIIHQLNKLMPRDKTSFNEKMIYILFSFVLISIVVILFMSKR